MKSFLRASHLQCCSKQLGNGLLRGDYLLTTAWNVEDDIRGPWKAPYQLFSYPGHVKKLSFIFLFVTVVKYLGYARIGYGAFQLRFTLPRNNFYFSADKTEIQYIPVCFEDI